MYNEHKTEIFYLVNNHDERSICVDFNGKCKLSAEMKELKWL